MPTSAYLAAVDIKINRIARGVYDLALGPTELRLALDDLRLLKAELDRVLAPEAAAQRNARHRAFLMKLVTAGDAGIQALLRRAGHDDSVVLMAAAAEMEELKAKLEANMTEKAARLLNEDMAFRYADGVPEGEMAAAMTRLLDAARALEEDGLMVYAARRPRPAATGGA